jgi:transcriptional regulator with GAF, ATPase, and Fis domain
LAAELNKNGHGQLFVLNPRDNTGTQEKVPCSINKIELLKYLANTLSMEIEALPDVPFPDVRSGIDFYGEVLRFEIMLVKIALEQTRGKQKEAARLLGLSPSTLSAFIKRHKVL